MIEAIQITEILSVCFKNAVFEKQNLQATDAAQSQKKCLTSKMGGNSEQRIVKPALGSGEECFQKA